MSEASQALQKIARGRGIVFARTVISMFFGCPNERLMNNTPRTGSGGYRGAYHFSTRGLGKIKAGCLDVQKIKNVIYITF